MSCNHDERFSGVFGLPKDCHGCLACYTEKISKELSRLYEQTQLTTEALQRVVAIIGMEFSSLEEPLADLLVRWNELCIEVDNDYKKDQPTEKNND